MTDRDCGISIAEKLKEARDKAGLSQQALADKSGVSRYIIANLETERRKDINLSQLQALAKGLEKPLTYFLDAGDV